MYDIQNTKILLFLVIIIIIVIALILGKYLKSHVHLFILLQLLYCHNS